MPHNDRRKYGQARLSTHTRGFSRRPAPSASDPAIIDLAERVRLRAERLRDIHGGVPSRAMQDIIEGRQKPLSSAGKRTLELFDTDLPTEEIISLWADDFKEWAREWAKRNGRNPDPTTPAGALPIRRAA